MLSKTDRREMRFVEKALVKKSKRKKKPLTVDEAASSAGFNALLRCSVRESAQLLDHTPPVLAKDSTTEWMEGPKMRVMLISEGLGNRRDMNYYGPEAMDSAPAAFEGAHCFLNHPSYTEERDIPERRVQDLCGYYKNVHTDVVEGRRCVTGELHFDLSKTGQEAYQKMITALHYQTEFPNADREYVGLSVNADGESEPRKINLEGEDAQVNYVTQFHNARSTDIVTLPARGGKALALVESSASADMQTKEVRTMLVKHLQAEQARLKEAIPMAKDEKLKKLLTESLSQTEAVLKEALNSASRKTKEGSAEMESDADASEADVEEAGDECEGEDALPAPGHTIKKTVTKKLQHTADSADGADDEDDEEKEAEAKEANRLAVSHLITKSGLDAGLFDAEDMARRGLKEAKREISRMKRVSESFARKAMQVLGDVSPAHAAKFSESGKPGGKVDNTDLFAGCSR